MATSRLRPNQIIAQGVLNQGSGDGYYDGCRPTKRSGVPGAARDDSFSEVIGGAPRPPAPCTARALSPPICWTAKVDGMPTWSDIVTTQQVQFGLQHGEPHGASCLRSHSPIALMAASASDTTCLRASSSVNTWPPLYKPRCAVPGTVTPDTAPR
jgi:hypothetical protein